MSIERVAIIGAGIAGLSCARALQAAGVAARLLESSSRLGGRCSTRLWQGHLVDDGISFFTAQAPDFKRELISRLRQLRPIIPPVCNAAEQIVLSPGGPRFYVLQGNNYFAQVLAQGLDLKLDVPVKSVAWREKMPELNGELYRGVVSSLPFSRTARLLGLAAAPAESPPQIAALLEYAGAEIGDSARCFGRLLGDEGGPIAASYCENHKVGRIVGDKTVFVVHAGEQFSARHAGEPQEEYVDELIRANDEIWKIPAGKGTASSAYPWRPRNEPAGNASLPLGAFLCGDARTGISIEEAWLDGRRAANEVLAFLAAPPTQP